MLRPRGGFFEGVDLSGDHRPQARELVEDPYLTYPYDFLEPPTKLKRWTSAPSGNHTSHYAGDEARGRPDK
jgi:hypothetical protein